MNFDKEMKCRKIAIEGIIEELLPREEGLQKTVIKAMNYSILSGGKRLRPMLMVETFRLFDGAKEGLVEPFMAAIEMIHTYSLVHDDLPAMDNDEYRRGRKTTHIVYGEAMAILAGDGLLNYAFETAIKAFENIDNNPDTANMGLYKRIVRALSLLMKKAGIYGMIGGQTVDVEKYDTTANIKRLDFIYKLKTAALIEGSMMIGAILAGADEVQINTIESIASDIGLAFQIKDDVLDMTSSRAVLGKPVHSDEKNDKATYVTMMGISSANDQVVMISDRAIRAYDTLPYKNEFLRGLIINLISRDR